MSARPRSSGRRPSRGRGVSVWLIALLVALVATIQLRSEAEVQRSLVGTDATSLAFLIDDLHRAVDEVAAALARVDRRVDGSITNSSLVRYDAYEGAGGHQSASIALLDAGRSGIVVSAIQGRDYARIYVKEIDRGHASVALSPEELEAVERAMSS